MESTIRTNSYEAAEHRVRQSELNRYYDILMYDWNEGEDHYEWVATAPELEIVEWAEAIRRDEQTQDN